LATDNKPSRLERLIEWAAPGVALRRAEARDRLQTARAYSASYRGGIATRTSAAWSGNDRSYRYGTNADRRSLADMRDRARRIYRDNPIGKSILNTETDNVVADGFTLQAKTPDPAFNKEVEERWDAWLEEADMRGMLCGADVQRQAYRSPRRDGDGGVVLVESGGQSRLQFIPGDLIQSPLGIGATQRLDNGNVIVDGVELDAGSRPVAFHVLDTDEMGKREYSRVGRSNFIYLTPELDDDLGVRGTTCYSTIFADLDGLDGYKDAVVVAARMGCVFGLIYKTAKPGAALSQLATAQNSEGRAQKAVTLENGMLKYIGTDEDMVQVQANQPMQQTPEFIRSMMRLIGVPFDMPLEMIAKDMSTVNFASARIGLISYYRACRTRQERFVRRFLARVYAWWVSRERKRQLLGYPDAFVTPFPPGKFWAAAFLPRAWGYTDPVSEAQADLLQISMGTKSPQMVSAEQGRDWETLVIENAAAEAERRAKQLSPMVLSTLTRDAIVVHSDGGGAPAGPDPALERIKAEADAYGVVARAGVVTPQPADEESFRTKLTLPPMSDAVRQAWEKDQGTRRPITLAPPSGAASPAPGIVPDPNTPDGAPVENA
jgi:lambda family phage portal protein